MQCTAHFHSSTFDRLPCLREIGHYGAHVCVLATLKDKKGGVLIREFSDKESTFHQVETTEKEIKNIYTRRDFVEDTSVTYKTGS